MAKFENLDRLLDKPVPRTSTPIVAERLWDIHSSPFTTPLDQFYEEHFSETGYYTRQCRLFNHHASSLTIKTHAQVTDVARLLRQHLQRKEILELMCTSLGPAEQARHQKSINLVIRLVLMMKVGNVEYDCFGGSVEWEAGTLREFVQSCFGQSPRLGHERMKLENTFNGLNLQRIAGIEIKWTDNLLDHLKLKSDDRVVLVFRHAAFLKTQKHSDLYPPGFVDETLRTLALLFPQDKKDTRSWFKKISRASSSPLDCHLVNCGILGAEGRQFENFGFWHDRLVTLKQVYNEARPQSISQRWHDRRHPTEWYTFWTAALVIVLTVIFGFAQCIFAFIQVYIAWKQWAAGGP
ncbi:hypothetical protein B0T16DRAFT_407579 [Cercophora newfieldiana]|uniref:Uncharacterized protein n=1 Tax=Cercophora newfieldiana TaxID=92897 RepID=A0AA39Y960_9PEZI|nr:hypothetical protein B0T16DRAFT_407579 [Cercophora newfieldiana]